MTLRKGGPMTLRTGNDVVPIAHGHPPDHVDVLDGVLVAARALRSVHLEGRVGAPFPVHDELQLSGRHLIDQDLLDDRTHDPLLQIRRTRRTKPDVVKVHSERLELRLLVIGERFRLTGERGQLRLDGFDLLELVVPAPLELGGD